MSHGSLDDTIRGAEKRAQQSQEEHEAAKKIRRIPWIQVGLALPQHDSGMPVRQRRQFLVRLMPGKRLAVACFGYEGHDWWVTPDGRLLTADFGSSVVGWCPLPATLGADTCDDEDSGRPAAPVPSR